MNENQRVYFGGWSPGLIAHFIASSDVLSGGLGDRGSLIFGNLMGMFATPVGESIAQTPAQNNC